MKKLIWLSDSRSNVKAFPATIRDDFGYALYLAQHGGMSARAKPLHGLYTVSIGDSIYVIHAFQKKSKAGVVTPKQEIQLIRQRLKQLLSEVKNAEKKSS